MISTIFFDLDGTIVDTEPTAAKVISESFQEWGYTLDKSDAHFLTGRTWNVAFDYLLKKYPPPISPEETAKLIMGRYQSALKKEVHAVPGSVKAVKSLAKEYPLALVSGSRREEIEIILKTLGILDCFQFFLGAQDYPASKPDPSGYLMALKKLGKKNTETLVFEDSTPGIQSARAAGLWVVAITSTNHFGHTHDLSHHQIPDLTQVDPSWIKKLNFSASHTHS